MENIPLGFIYYLQNPKTGEIFYVGATESSLKNRLRTHYQHLSEYVKGIRKHNNRYEYLLNMKPLKATVHLLEIVTDGELWKREKYYIKHFRKMNPKLTNMTDGGRGNYTHKYYSEEKKQEIAHKISKANKGRKKPDGFSEHLSKIRKGVNNPATKEIVDWIIADEKYLFKYGFEINTFINSIHAYGNVYRGFKRIKSRVYNHKWEKFSNVNKKIQDIVQSNYESREY